MYRPFEEFRTTGRCISVIGSGGKTTFLHWLADHLPGRVILTTSTHILPFPGIPLIDVSRMDRDQVIAAVRSALSENRAVCLGKSEPSGKLADPSSVLPFEDLLAEADHLLVEADGAARLPLKAHRPWEPVIPACSDLTVCLAGASGLGRPVSEACHCPELFASLAGISMNTPVSAKHVAAVLNREALADCYLINQADTLADPAQARRLCDLIGRDAFICSLSSLLNR